MIVYRCRYLDKIFHTKEGAFEFAKNYLTPRDSAESDYEITFIEKENKRIYKRKSNSELIGNRQITISWKEEEE